MGQAAKQMIPAFRACTTKHLYQKHFGRCVSFRGENLSSSTEHLAFGSKLTISTQMEKQQSHILFPIYNPRELKGYGMLQESPEALEIAGNKAAKDYASEKIGQLLHGSLYL